MASTSPRTLPIESFSFGTSSEVSSREVFFSADRYLLALEIWGHMQSRSPRVHAWTLLDTVLLTRNGPKAPSEGGPPGTHVVHGDCIFRLSRRRLGVLWRDRGGDPLAVRGLRAARDSSSSTTPTPSSMGETRTSFTNSTLWCPGSVVCAPVVLRAFMDICRLWALAQEGSGTSLAVRGTTCVAPGQLGVDAPSSSSVCARLHRFLFGGDRTAVHEAGSAS